MIRRVYSTLKVPKPQRPANEPIEQMRARLLYSSRKRGILETDLLLSTYAQRYLSTLSHEQLKEYDILLEENDWDIYYWLTQSKKAPDQIKQFTIFPQLLEHCKNRQREILRMPNL